MLKYINGSDEKHMYLKLGVHLFILYNVCLLCNYFKPAYKSYGMQNYGYIINHVQYVKSFVQFIGL